MEAKVVRLRIVNQPVHLYDRELDQEFQSLADEAARIRIFTELPEKQQRTMVLAGKNDGARAIRRMIQSLAKLAERLPAGSWD